MQKNLFSAVCETFSLFQIKVSFVFILLDKRDFPCLCSTLVWEWRSATKCISGNQFSSKYVIQTFLPSKSVILIIIDIDYPNISSMNMFSWIAWYCFLCIEHLIPLTNEIKHTVDYSRDVLIHYWQPRKKYYTLTKKAYRFRLKAVILFWTMVSCQT